MEQGIKPNIGFITHQSFYSFPFNYKTEKFKSNIFSSNIYDPNTTQLPVFFFLFCLVPWNLTQKIRGWQILVDVEQTEILS